MGTVAKKRHGTSSQPLLMHIDDLQVLRLPGQLTHPGHVRFQLAPVAIDNTDSYYRPLPFVLKVNFDNRGVETGTQPVFQAAHGTALVLQRPGPRDYQFDSEQGNKES